MPHSPPPSPAPGHYTPPPPLPAPAPTRAAAAPLTTLLATLLSAGLAHASSLASALASALWIAICAAAPEFIWRGLSLTIGHFDHTTLAAALLIGLFLAFFVEPAIERLRALLSGEVHRHGHHHAASHAHRHPTPHATPAPRRGALFAALVGIAFAFASYFLHASMTAYIAERAGEHAPTSTGLAATIHLTLAWAAVPFAVTLAWLASGRLWRAVPLGILAAASPLLAGWLFAWTPREILTTAIPCLAIQLLGYRALPGERERSFIRCAASTARVAALWLVLALAVDELLAALGVGRLGLYESAPDFWIDVRFYLGWALGLLFAPFPHPAAERAAGL
ncbi:MAG TPA: hypothetical protein VMA86_10105 [Acetobacteraceae bacterium]|nr:hypothetical protein [Acetobacteraceae bacterium]